MTVPESSPVARGSHDLNPADVPYIPTYIFTDDVAEIRAGEEAAHDVLTELGFQSLSGVMELSTNRLMVVAMMLTSESTINKITREQQNDGVAFLGPRMLSSAHIVSHSSAIRTSLGLWTPVEGLTVSADTDYAALLGYQQLPEGNDLCMMKARLMAFRYRRHAPAVPEIRDVPEDLLVD